MPHSIATIVEGHGEVKAVPVLFRRIAHEIFEKFDVSFEQPFRLARDKFRAGSSELEKAVRFLVMKKPSAIFVIFDSDDDCPVDVAQQVKEFICTLADAVPVYVVAAQREYESWLLAGVEGLAVVDTDEYLQLPENLQSIRDAKGRL